MAQQSRFINAIKNVGVAGILQIINLLVSFVSRTIFIDLLGNDYLSCDGLFTNILTLLSFSELGIGSAIIYSLYQPIAENDRVKIGKLMNLFRVSYRYISCAITVLGLCVIPFLGILVRDVPDVKEDIALLYCMFLLNTVSTYIYGYKRSFLIANQENYIVLSIQHGVHFLKIILQIMLLLITHDYVTYLSIGIVCNLMTNIITTVICNKKYPWINTYIKEKLSKDERKPIFQNISAIVQYKLGSVILNGSDNILISAILKTAYVGLYSNYNMIVNAITVIVNQVASGLQATIGNYNVSNSNEDKFKMFQILHFISFWVFGFFSVCIAVLITPFIEGVWLGPEYTVSYNVVIALSLVFFVHVINIIPSTYRTTMGFFQEAKKTPILAAILNIVLSVILGILFGLSGIFFATAISRLFTYNIIDPYYVFKKGFNINPMKYYIKLCIYFGILIFNYLVTFFISDIILVNNIYDWMLRLFVCCAVSNIIFFVIFCKTSIFAQTLKLIKSFLKRRKA